jgi:membrane-bound ClpP family serine protease
MFSINRKGTASSYALPVKGNCQLQNANCKFAIYILQLAMVFLIPISAATAQDPAAEISDGQYIYVRNPINTDVVNRVKTQVKRFLDRAPHQGAKIVFDFNPQGYPSSTSDYGSCRELAAFILEIQDVTTIAFVHVDQQFAEQPAVTGHTMLPVLACKQIVMSIDARMGDAARDQAGPILPDQLQFYEHVARSRGRYPAIILKMLDKDVDVVEGTLNNGVWYIDKRHKKDEAGFQETGPAPGLSPGRTGMYTAHQAEKFYRLCDLIRETPQEVIEAFGLPPRSLHGDPLQGRTPNAWRIVVRGPFDAGMQEKLERRVRQIVAQRANLIFLQLECGGGDPVIARQLADFFRTLRDDRGDDPVMTVAFVTRHSHDLALFLALGCTEIVMDDKAKLGFEDWVPGRPDAWFEKPLGEREKLRNSRIGIIEKPLVELAQEQGYSPLLVRGMVNPELAIFRVRNQKGRLEQFLVDGAELEKDRKDKKNWGDAEEVKKAGQWFSLNADEAMKPGIGLSQHKFEGDPDKSFAQVKNYYGLDRVREAGSDWLDAVAAFLCNKVVAMFLVMIGIAALILEFKLPGATVPGIVAAICFVLYFWSHSQVAGNLTWLGILLFLLGLVLIGLEVFVFPGVGVLGISGVALMLGSLALVTLVKKPETSREWFDLGVTVTTLGLSLVGAVIGAIVLAWYLPHMPFAHRMILKPSVADVEGLEEEPLSSLDANAELLGAIGIAATSLRPAGKVRFGDEYVDVVAEGDYVEIGSRVQVIEIEGNRIVVKQV